MRYRIVITGYGGELFSSAVDKYIVDYIKDEHNGDFESYIDACFDGDVPDELTVAPSLDGIYDDFYDDCGLTDSTIVHVYDEDGEEVFSSEFSSVHEVVRKTYVLGPLMKTDAARWALIVELKGDSENGYFEGFIECEKFDRALLTVTGVSYKCGDNTFTFNNGAEYDGKKIDLVNHSVGPLGREWHFFEFPKSEKKKSSKTKSKTKIENSKKVTKKATKAKKVTKRVAKAKKVTKKVAKAKKSKKTARSSSSFF